MSLGLGTAARFSVWFPLGASVWGIHASSRHATPWQPADLGVESWEKKGAEAVIPGCRNGSIALHSTRCA